MSQSIAFIGVGNMGCPMAENLMKAGKFVKVFDVSKKMLEIARDKNIIKKVHVILFRDASALLALLNIELPLAAIPPIPSPLGL